MATAISTSCSLSLGHLSRPAVRSSLCSLSYISRTTSLDVSPRDATCHSPIRHIFVIQNQLPKSFSPSAITYITFCSPLKPSNFLSLPSLSSSSLLLKAIADSKVTAPFSTSSSSSATLSAEETSESANASAELSKEDDSKWQVKMLYDGDCPLCMREVNMLRERSKSHGNRIFFVDIASSDYNPEANSGISFETAMEKIHAIERDGRILTDIAAFRRFYEAVDLGWIYAITTVKPIGAIADALYGVWAKNRLPITGRPSIEVVMEERRRKREEGEACNVGDNCRTG